MKWTQTQPDSLPATWAQLRAHLRLDDELQRDYVMELAETAVSYAETEMGRSLMPRTVTAVHYLNGTNGGAYPFGPGQLNQGRYLDIPRGPVISMTSVKAADDTDVDYSLEYVGNAARIVVLSVVNGPSPTITAVYQAGYANAKAIPAHLRHAIKMHVAHLYNNAEAFTDKAQVPTPAGLVDFYRGQSWETGVG